MSEISPKVRALGQGLLLSLLSVLLCLAVAEAWLTLQHRHERRALEEKYPGRERCSARSEHPELIYTLVPGRCRVNSRGYRGEDHPLEKPAGSFRVMVIGDSVAQGQGVRPRETFGEVLEDLLQETSGGGTMEVIVLARTGYSTSQELFLLEREAFAYSPDLLVWSYVLNDPAHPVYHDANGELGRYYHEPRLHVVELVRRGLFRLREGWRRRGCSREFHAFLHCVYRDQVRGHLLRIGEAAEAQGVPVLFAIHPVFEEGGDFGAYGLRAVHAQLAADAADAGLEVVDLLAEYEPYGPDELRQHPGGRHDPWHPNALGHRLAAEGLHRAIVAGRPFRTWVDESASP